VGGSELNGQVTHIRGSAKRGNSAGRIPALYPTGSALYEMSQSEPAGTRVAVVTGGNRGLGLQIVQMLAERGMRVVLTSRSVDRGRTAVDFLGDLADRVAVRQLDITDPGSISRFASWLRRCLGRCDVLVNNGAVLIDDDATVTGVDLDVVRRTLETNLLGTWRLTQAIAPLMRNCRYGRIVNVSSGLGSLATMRGDLPAYRVSKSAVNSLTRMLADELAGDGILINACCPGRARVEVGEARFLSASADTPVWLATLPDDGPTGGFYRNRMPIDW